MSTLQRAIEIAVEAHKGQMDKAGMPYILHPLRLMFQMKTDNEKMAAVLHDVVEDSDWTLDDLKKEGFNSEVLKAVSLLTRDDNDSYDEFVQKAASNPISKAVKIADITDNLDLSRISNVTDKDVARVKKYQRVLKTLTEE
jgi:(p)ppGpp synthase/HD superfamily hydrolase|tara:strand:- start:1361 stop:1783 length:423 start_codon:yes stop_codon:yes gene_type:complete